MTVINRFSASSGVAIVVGVLAASILGGGAPPSGEPEARPVASSAIKERGIPSVRKVSGPVKWSAISTARLDTTAGKDPSAWGEWIADVERPAEEYRGRYQARLADRFG
jgi:hypothetical protein